MNNILTNKKIFLRFLKENYCYSEYIKNFTSYNNRFNMDLNTFFLKEKPKYFLCNSFGWLSSKYKANEWALIEDKWDDFYEKWLVSSTV